MEPVRCYSCNAVLNFKVYHEAMDSSKDVCAALACVHAERFCCRRMYVSHPTELADRVHAAPLRNLVREDDYTLELENSTGVHRIVLSD